MKLGETRRNWVKLGFRFIFKRHTQRKKNRLYRCHSKILSSSYGIVLRHILVLGAVLRHTWVAEKLGETLTLINQAFYNGVFLKELKMAKVIPVYKSGSKIKLNNYRTHIICVEHIFYSI